MTPKVRSDREKQRFKSIMMQKTEDEILRLLANGSSHTAKEIGEFLMRAPSGKGYVWESLIKMEKTGLAWRAHHFDWRRANNWEITGCGRIIVAVPQQTPGA